jgi:hypothetical protein
MSLLQLTQLKKMSGYWTSHSKTHMMQLCLVLNTQDEIHCTAA